MSTKTGYLRGQLRGLTAGAKKIIDQHPLVCVYNGEDPQQRLRGASIHRGKGTMEDKELIRKVIDRDEAALGEIDRKYGAYLRSIARGILSDARDVEECVSDAMLKAWNRLPEAEPDDLKAYLGMLVRTAAISRKREQAAAKRGGGREATPFDELEELVGDGDVAEAADQALLAKLISGFLRERPSEERIMFVRRYWYGDSVAQIAAAFGAGQSKVKMTLKRTRDKLRKVLKKEGYIE